MAAPNDTAKMSLDEQLANPELREQVTAIFRREQRALTKAYRDYMEAYATISESADQEYTRLGIELGSPYLFTPQASMFTTHNMGGNYNVWFEEKE